MLFPISDTEIHSTWGTHSEFTLPCNTWAFLVDQNVKNLSTMWETWVQSLGQEDPLEKGMATHSNILAWRIPWTQEPSRLQSLKSRRVGMTEQLTHTHIQTGNTPVLSYALVKQLTDKCTFTEFTDFSLSRKKKITVCYKKRRER